MMKKVKRILIYLKFFILSKYGCIAVFLLFLAHITFIDEHNLLKKRNLRRANNALIEENKKSEKYIKEKDNEIRSFSTDKQYLEKYARENFSMKEQNEDIFLFNF